MSYLDRYAGLYTDHYELTMAQGYFLQDRQDSQATFDYFFRKNPFQGGYVIFAGLGDLLEVLENLRFEPEALQYLQSIGFRDNFLRYLRDFRFQASIYAPPEVEVVFPNEPILRVEGTLVEAQIIESLVLNILNFQSLIATKASRIRQVAGERKFIDFGMRRAQGLGAIHASKAAIIGGADSTSNVYSGFAFGLQTTGTMAHSWVQSYEQELDAFRDFARSYPDKCVLLVDTYDTLKSGIPNAISIGKEMREHGHELYGVRLDSGDLSYLSKQARQMLDEAGMEGVKILVSNQLDEYVIKSLNEQKAPIDAFGVGTNLIIGRDDAALDGVYKLTQWEGKPSLKISENIEKIILPANKKLYRYFDEHNMMYADGIALEDEDHLDRIYHPHDARKRSEVQPYRSENLHRQVMDQGQLSMEKKHPEELQAYVRARLDSLPEEHRRFDNPHIYKVGISHALMQLRDQLIEEKKSYIAKNL
jgi:nicotinate phosphoribosyltransferase